MDKEQYTSLCPPQQKQYIQGVIRNTILGINEETYSQKFVVPPFIGDNYIRDLVIVPPCAFMGHLYRRLYPQKNVYVLNVFIDDVSFWLAPLASRELVKKLARYIWPYSWKEYVPWYLNDASESVILDYEGEPSMYMDWVQVRAISFALMNEILPGQKKHDSLKIGMENSIRSIANAW